MKAVPNYGQQIPKPPPPPYWATYKPSRPQKAQHHRSCGNAKKAMTSGAYYDKERGQHFCQEALLYEWNPHSRAWDLRLYVPEGTLSTDAKELLRIIKATPKDGWQK